MIYNYPDYRRKLAFAYPCWKAYPGDIAALIALVNAQDSSSGVMKSLGTNKYSYLVCLPSIGESEAGETKKDFLFTRTGETISTDNDIIYEAYYLSGIKSGIKKGYYSFSRLPINFATGLYNFLYRASGDQMLLVDVARKKVRACQYGKKDLLITPSFRGEEADVNFEFNFWELDDNGNF